MSNATYKFLNTIAENFMQNRLETVAEHFAYPMPYYAEDCLQVFGASCTLTEAIALYREAIAQAGIVKMVPRVLAEGLRVNGYSNVWVEWDHFDETDKSPHTSQVRYVFYQDDNALFPKIELMEYTSQAFPNVSASLYEAKIA